MSYSIYINKNIILDSNQVNLPESIQSVMPDSDSITISKTFCCLNGYDVAEAFEPFRKLETDEISLEELIEFLTIVDPDLVNNPLLENTSNDSVFFSYFESY